ncbi:MAG: helix-turn-helix domain-containing protein [Fibrobacteria bacterium]|nr:helix-turn-helix domain-containing protein [Fibrobacteria bacterium]
MTEEDLPVHIKTGVTPGKGLSLDIPDEGICLEEVEHQLILNAIAKAGGNKTKAAQLLNISRRTLYSRLESYEEGRGA